jgi:ATP-dependent exoDNAse (exonuclease V) alpha subunit
VAVYYLNLKTFGRAAGSSAPSAAAYRAGERIRDERTGRTYDFTTRQDVMHKEILLPSEFSGSEMSWARDRSSLWNAAEAAERRGNSRVAREYLVALPAELDRHRQIAMVREFAQELVERYRFAMDVAIHAPRDFPGSDPRNFHAHLLATTREVTPVGLGAKTSIEMHEIRRRRSGLKSGFGELLQARERWAVVANAALEHAHVNARIDHRSLAAQGIQREPPLQRPAERMADREADREAPSARHQEGPARHQERSNAGLSLEEIQRRARENWLQLRREMLAGEAAKPDGREAAREGASRDDEFGK